MLVKNVSSGEPITAAWANSLVNTVNHKNGLVVDQRGIEFTKAAVDLKFSNDAAWQISVTDDKQIILNAGQIYINGILVKPQKNGKNSYNQFCSAENWDKVAIQEWNKDALPVFVISIEAPKQVTEENIKEVKAVLKLQNEKGENLEGNEEEDEGNGDKWKKEIQLNEIVDGEIKQLVSGSIYISQNAVLPKAKEGIIITDDPVEEDDETQTTAEGENEEEKKTEKVIKLHVSIIGEDGIEVLDSLYQKSHEDVNPDAEKEENPARIFTIRGKRISFIGEDGITIEEEQEMLHEDEGGTLETPKEQTIYKIKGQAFSIIGEDGIFVHEEKVQSGEKEITQYTIHGKKISLIAKDEMKLKLEFQTGEDNSVATDGTVIKSKWDYWTLQPKGISIIAGDGISIIHTDDLENFVECYEIVATGTNNISFVGLDKIKIAEREGVGNNEETRKEIYVVNDHFSLIPTDNLRIEKENGECSFSDGSFSVKRNWETNKLKSKFVSLKEGNNIKLDKNEIDTSDKWEDEYTINAKIISVIAGDNVRVDVSEDEFGKSFTVHAKISEIEFDPLFFIVENGTVTLKEDALNELVNEAINEIGVEVMGEGLIESTFKGELKANTSGTLTLNTSVSY